MVLPLVLDMFLGESEIVYLFQNSTLASMKVFIIISHLFCACFSNAQNIKITPLSDNGIQFRFEKPCIDLEIRDSILVCRVFDQEFKKVTKQLRFNIDENRINGKEKIYSEKYYSYLVFEKIDDFNIVIGLSGIGRESDIPIQDKEGNDSIDNEGNYVYPSREPEFYNVGVYNLQAKEWIINPSYENIHSKNDYFFAHHGYRWKQEVKGYDLFHWKKKKVKLIKENILEENIELLSNLKVYDSVHYLNVPFYYEVYRSGESKIVQFQLFCCAGEGMSTLFSWADYCNFSKRKKFVAKYSGPSKVIEFSENEIIFNESHTNMPSTSFIYTIDNWKFNSIGAFDDENISFQSQVQIIKKDEYLILNDNTRMYEVVSLVDQYGEDSIDFNYNKILDFDLNKSFSGVYDFHDKNWIIPRSFDWIIPTEKGFIGVLSKELNTDFECQAFEFGRRGNFIRELESVKESNRQATTAFQCTTEFKFQFQDGSKEKEIVVNYSGEEIQYNSRRVK